MFETIIQITVLASVIPVTLFIILYATRSPWRTSEVGRTLMTQKIAFLLVFLFIATSLLFPDYFGRDWVREAVYLLLLFTFCWEVSNLYKTQRNISKLPRPRIINPLRRKDKLLK